MATSSRKKKRRKQRRQRMIRRCALLTVAVLAVLAVVLIVRGRSKKPDPEIPLTAPTEPVQVLAEPVAEPTDPPAAAPALELRYDADGTAHYAYGELPESAPVNDSYFDDAVFMGDSVMQGFCYDIAYRRKTTAPGWFGTAQFLTAQSYSLYHATHDAANSDNHPSYRGKTQPVKISLRDMGAKKIYIMLGMNDVFSFGVMKSLDNYEALIADIRTECPDAEIVLLSVIPCTRNAVKKNSKMDVGAYTFFNQRLPDLAQKNNCYYVNVAAPYLDEEGYLKSEYSSDDYVHIQSGCFDFWADALRTHTSLAQ